MPMRSTPIIDAAGNVIGRACSREPARRVRCATAGCSGSAVVLCDFPVTRRGRQTTCNRRVCRGCARSLGKGQDFCPPHARAADSGGGSALVTVCGACFGASCAALEDGHTCARRAAAGTKSITVREWKRWLSFGAIK